MDELETQEEAERKRREAAEAEAKVWTSFSPSRKKYFRIFRELTFYFAKFLPKTA